MPVELNVEKPGQSVAKVSFTVPASEYQKEVQRGLQQAGRHIRMKGFRPGKVPVQVVEKQHGEQVRQEVKQFFIQRAYQKAIEDEGLKPIAHPRVNLEDLVQEGDGDFSVEFEISLRPEIELPDYRGWRIDSELEPVMEQEIEEAIDEVKKQQSHPEPVGDEGLQESGMLLCDIAFMHEDEAVFEREGLRISPITPPPGVDPDAFKDALLGTKDDDVVEIEMTLPETLENEAVRGQQGVCRVTAKQTFDMVPPADEDLFKLFEADDEGDLKAKVRVRLTEAKEQREQTRQETEILERVLRGVQVDLPASLLEDQTRARLQQLHERLSEQGVEHDEIHKQMNESEAEARQEAEKGLKALLVVEAIGEKEKLQVTQEDLEVELAAIAERNQADIEEVRKYYVENNLGQQMSIEVLERKVRRFLRENVTVETPS